MTSLTSFAIPCLSFQYSSVFPHFSPLLVFSFFLINCKVNFPFRKLILQRKLHLYPGQVAGVGDEVKNSAGKFPALVRPVVLAVEAIAVVAVEGKGYRL